MEQFEWNVDWNIQISIKTQSIQYFWQQNIHLYNFVGESASRHRIREKYPPTRVLYHWIKNCVKENQVEIIKYRHWNANPIHPPMPDLPWERYDEHVFPFNHTGVDYFEPFEVKFIRRTLKRWCCLFTILTTRAIHWSDIVNRHRAMSSCSDENPCKTTEHHHQWKWNELRWSSERAESIHEVVEQS